MPEETQQNNAVSDNQQASMAVLDNEVQSQATESAAQVEKVQPEAQPQAQPTIGLTADQLADAFKKAGIGQPVQQQEEPQMSEEEFNRRLNVYQPTPQLLKAIREGDEVAALSELTAMVQGITRYAATLSGLAMQQRMAEMDKRYQPALSHAQAQQMKQWKEDFTKQFPDLAPYEALGENVVAALKAEGAKFKTIDEAFGEVSKRMRTVLKQMGIDASKTANQNGSNAGIAAQTQQGQQTRMSTLSGGGQGAGNSTGQAQKSGNRSAGLEVFD